MTVFASCILGVRQTDREADGQRGSGGCRDGQLSKNEQMSGFKGAARVSESTIKQKQ